MRLDSKQKVYFCQSLSRLTANSMVWESSRQDTCLHQCTYLCNQSASLVHFNLHLSMPLCLHCSICPCPRCSLPRARRHPAPLLLQLAASPPHLQQHNNSLCDSGQEFAWSGHRYISLLLFHQLGCKNRCREQNNGRATFCAREKARHRRTAIVVEF